MINKILVAMDGSEHAQKALELASDVAKLYGASLTLVHVITDEPIPDALIRAAEIEHVTEPPPVDMSLPRAAAVHGSNAVAQREHEKNRVREYIGNKVLNTGKQFARSKRVKDIKSILEAGDAAERILARGDQEQPDMIVLGSRGFGKLKALVVGSVSSEVTNRAKCTCVTVK